MPAGWRCWNHWGSEERKEKELESPERRQWKWPPISSTGRIMHAARRCGWWFCSPVGGGDHRGDLSGGCRRAQAPPSRRCAIVGYGRGGTGRGVSSVRTAADSWQPELFLGVAAGTLLVVALGSLYKIAELSAGGETVALMLGGRAVDPQTTDLAERRLLNVVEEMALASGIPVPPVYVLDNEPSINAFAAGHQPGDAVVAVSAGAADVPLPRGTARRHGPRVQPHPQRRHAAEPAADRSGQRHPRPGDPRLLHLAVLGLFVARLGEERRRPRPCSCSAWRWSFSAISACSSAI